MPNRVDKLIEFLMGFVGSRNTLHRTASKVCDGAENVYNQDGIIVNSTYNYVEVLGLASDEYEYLKSKLTSYGYEGEVAW